MQQSEIACTDTGPCRILINRLFRLVCVGRLLILTAVMGSLAAFWLWDRGIWAWQQGSQWQELVQWLLPGCYAGLIMVFSLLDLRSRFQDYKRAKDLFFENGFNPRIAMLFIHSRCQRDAVGVAAKDLGMGPLLADYYQSRGYRWYHILPDFIFKRPAILFSPRYWRRTLFEPKYTSPYFHW